jgi:hypothetical protein
MRTYDGRLYRLEGPNIHALRRIEYSTGDLGGINNYEPLEPVLETMPAYPRVRGYS